jgi:peptide subunit release factor RF-3
MEFLDEPGSEDWGQDLYRTLKAFFESQLPIREFFDSLPMRD